MNEHRITESSIRAFWHKESFDRFINDRLPQLLAERLPLTGYSVEQKDLHTCQVRVALAGNPEIIFAIPQPDPEGLFRIDGALRVVVPIASGDNLETAEIKCVGEQLYDFIEARLGEGLSDMEWDNALAQAWIPLAVWVGRFLKENGQLLDSTNWLAVQTHLRRLLVSDMKRVVAPEQIGRTCVFETPEGPNIGRVLSVAVGAEIHEGRLIATDASPEGALGLSASMVPFIEHTEPTRQLMGVNMMRQWLVPPDPEPALVRTGNELDAPDFWCGRNLLTAFVSLGAMTYEDGIVISESAAKRFNYPFPMEPGDKISERHGTKGVISRIMPDDEMPHLANGTPVDLVYSFIGLHTRLNFGAVREALMGRIAHAEGTPAIVPPFHAPSAAELKERLRKAGLPESGMEILTMGCGGPKLDRPGMVGWVYWGKTDHCAKYKVHVRGGCLSDYAGHRQGEMEYFQLRDVGAVENLLEMFNTRATQRADAATLVGRVEAGPIEQAPPPTPTFELVVKRLASAGVAAKFDGEKVTFGLEPPKRDVLKLARPVPYPWLPGTELTEIGVCDTPEYAPLAEANAKLERLLQGSAPESMVKKALADLESRAAAYLTVLVYPNPHRPAYLEPFGSRPASLHLIANSDFSASTVLAPAEGLSVDQVGLADEIAWGLFGPLVTRELGDEKAVRERATNASEKLDEIMARSWVIVFRAPAFIPTAFIAFRPVRIPYKVIQLHPLVCFLINGDFDGDQAAVYLPLTEAAQREAGAKLSLAGHLRRDPGLYGLRFLSHDALWGLAKLSLTPGGLREVCDLAGVQVAAPDGFVTRDSVAAAMRQVVSRDGVEPMLAVIQRLMERGFEVTRKSGASISPFIGESLPGPADPEARLDALAARSSFDDSDLGPQVLAAKSGARGTLERLVRLVGPVGNVSDAAGNELFVRNGYRHGLTPEEVFACAAASRRNLAEVSLNWEAPHYGIREASKPSGFGVLARAMRSENPGAVFARAAVNGEADPLTDVDSRLFVGLRPL